MGDTSTSTPEIHSAHDAAQSLGRQPEELLHYWDRLAAIYDTYGLPVDFMYDVLMMADALPLFYRKVADNFGNACWVRCKLTEDEFKEQIAFCVRVRQVGGFDVLMQ